MTSSPLVDLSEAILAAVVGYWPPIPDAALPALLALPERRYVTVGTTPVADCEQLVVSVERTFGTQGSPAREEIVPISTGAPWLRTLVAQVQILRCVSVVTDNPAGGVPAPPAADAMSREAAAILSDADQVLECLIAAQAAGDLGGCGQIALENWRAIGEQGGLAGGTSRVRLNLF